MKGVLTAKPSAGSRKEPQSRSGQARQEVRAHYFCSRLVYSELQGASDGLLCAHQLHNEQRELSPVLQPPGPLMGIIRPVFPPLSCPKQEPGNAGAWAKGSKPNLLFD